MVNAVFVGETLPITTCNCVGLAESLLVCKDVATRHMVDGKGKVKEHLEVTLPCNGGIAKVRPKDNLKTNVMVLPSKTEST